MDIFVGGVQLSNTKVQVYFLQTIEMVTEWRKTYRRI